MSNFMSNFMLNSILILILLIMIGLLIEKAFHLDYDVKNLTLALRQDVNKFIKALFEAPPQRHFFDVTLPNDIRMQTSTYAKKGFDIAINNSFFRNVPVITISFVPEHELSENELLELEQLLKIVFKKYLAFYNLDWKHFITHTMSKESVTICIYYAELECDALPFRNQYHITVRQKVSNNSGILRDESLDEELQNVD